MTQGLLPWSPCHHSLSPTSIFALPLAFPTTKNTQFPVSISSTLEPESEPATATATTQQLTARERRQLRNERRESKTGTSWKEEVEEKLLEKPTKKFANWKEELNLNNLAHEGPQWWIIKVSRVKGQETAQLIARQLARNYPHIDFKEKTDNQTPSSAEFDMEAVFKQEKEEQQKAEQAFEQEQQEATLNDAAEFDGDSKPKSDLEKHLILS